MKLTWASDIHLNFISKELRLEFYSELNQADGDKVLFTGDMAEGHVLKKYLDEFKECIQKPVFFVLGNHDFYKSSTNEAYRIARKYNWLSHIPYIADENTALIGVDGWGDGRYGDYQNSHLIMNDWIYIEDLNIGYTGGKEELLGCMQRLADRDARKLKRKLLKVVKDFKKVIIATHVPPFDDCALFKGVKSTPSGLPFFASKILGDTILPIIKKNSEVQFLWLCGHTHSKAKVKICDNLTVKVAGAVYGTPRWSLVEF